jgi:hypothetical protein
LNYLGGPFILERHEWRMDIWFGVDDFFFSPPWFSCMNFHVFKAALQFVFSSYLVYIFLLLFILFEIIYRIDFFFNFIFLQFFYLSNLVSIMWSLFFNWIYFSILSLDILFYFIFISNLIFIFLLLFFLL